MGRVSFGSKAGGEKGRSPGEGSFPKEICPQGKGEAIAGDALQS